MDEFVRELRRRGSTYASPTANYYRANRVPSPVRKPPPKSRHVSAMRPVPQSSLRPLDAGRPLQLTALSAGKHKVLENRRHDSNDPYEFKGEQIVYLARKGEVKPAHRKSRLTQMLDD